MDKKFLDTLTVILIILLLFLGYNRYVRKNDISYKNIIQTITTQNEKPASYYISLAKEAYNAGNYQKAIDLWNQSLEAKPFHPDLVYHDLGLCYIELRDYDKALEAFNKAIELNPNDLAFYYMKAIVYRYTKNIEECRANLEKVISMKEQPSVYKQGVVESYKMLAELENNSGNFNKANEYNSLANEFSAKIHNSGN